MNSTPDLGIDIAKDKFDAVLLIQSIHRKTFDNTPAGHRDLLQWLTQLRALDCHACMEATGRYSTALATFLHQNKISISVVNPLAIHYFARSEMSRNKTDAHDALLIARYCREKKPRLWKPVDAEHQRLRDLVRLREQLIEARVVAELHQEDAPPILANYFDAHVRLLKRQILKVEQSIDQCLKGTAIGADAALIQSIPGLGKITAVTVLATMPALSELTSARQLAAFAGVTPQQDDSGTRKGKAHLSKLGHSRLRKALYFPAITALRCNVRIQALARRLGQKGKCKMVIIGAAMRQLLHLVYGVLKTRKPFDPNHLNASTAN